MFRDDFVWGAASSACQIEGRDAQDGAGKCVWDSFIQDGHIPDHSDARVPDDHMHRYPEEGLKKYAAYLPRITPEDMQLISQPLDFMGQNIYNGYPIRAGENGEPEFVNRTVGSPKTAANWPVTPQCLYWGVKFLYERYQLPLYITENGMSCHDVVPVDGRVHDPNRQDFLDRYLSAL